MSSGLSQWALGYPFHCGPEAEAQAPYLSSLVKPHHVGTLGLNPDTLSLSYACLLSKTTGVKDSSGSSSGNTAPDTC